MVERGKSEYDTKSLRSTEASRPAPKLIKGGIMKKLKKKNGEGKRPAALTGHRRPLTLEDVENRLLKSVLTGTLALQMLKTSRKSVSHAIKELLDIEICAGQLISRAFEETRESRKPHNPRGALANAYSFLPMPSATPGMRDVTSSQGSQTRKVKNGTPKKTGRTK